MLTSGPAFLPAKSLSVRSVHARGSPPRIRVCPGSQPRPCYAAAPCRCHYRRNLRAFTCHRRYCSVVTVGNLWRRPLNIVSGEAAATTRYFRREIAELKERMERIVKKAKAWRFRRIETMPSRFHTMTMPVPYAVRLRRKAPVPMPSTE